MSFCELDCRNSKNNESLRLHIWKVSPTEAIIQIITSDDKSNSKPLRLYDIKQLDSDGIICKADVPGSDPVVVIDVNKNEVSLKVKGTMLGIGDRDDKYHIDDFYRNRLVKFLEEAKYSR